MVWIKGSPIEVQGAGCHARIWGIHGSATQRLQVCSDTAGGLGPTAGIAVEPYVRYWGLHLGSMAPQHSLWVLQWRPYGGTGERSAMAEQNPPKEAFNAFWMSELGHWGEDVRGNQLILQHATAHANMMAEAHPRGTSCT